MSAGRPPRGLPGSFDPVTNGHLDIIGRAADLYDEVVVAVFDQPDKSSLFTVDERREMLTEVDRRLRQRPGRLVPRPAGRLLPRPTRSR